MNILNEALSYSKQKDDNRQVNILAQTFGNQKRWVNYRSKILDGKTTKVPYGVTGRKASSTDPSTWSTYKEVTRVSDKIGIVFTQDQKLLGIDIDHCLKNGVIDCEQKDAIVLFIREANTYTEISPSGEGLHLFLSINESMPLLANKKAPFECYTSGRYFTVTDKTFGEPQPVRNVTKDEAQRLLEIIGYPWGKNVSENTRQSSLFSDDAMLLEKMFASKNGHKIRALYDGNITGHNGDESSADMALCSHLAFWTARNASQIERIWLASPLGSRKKTQERKDYRDRTIDACITGCKEVFEGNNKQNEKSNIPVKTKEISQERHTALLEAAPKDILKENESAETKKERFNPISLDELFSMEPPKNKWVIEGLIPYQCMTLVSGAPASYKTWLLLKMALTICEGTSLFGKFPCEQNNVLIINEEDYWGSVRERLQLLGAGKGLNIYLLSQKGFLVSDENAVEMLLEVCEEKKIGVIIMDSLVRISKADENSASEMSEVFRIIKKFCQNSMTVIVTHHDRKEGKKPSSPEARLRGSSDILASADCHLAIKRDKNNRNKISIEQTKIRQGKEIEPFELEIKEDKTRVDFDYLGGYQKDQNKKDLAMKAVKSILKKEKDGMSIGKIKKKVKELKDIGERNTADAIKELLSKKTIFMKDGKRNEKICCLVKIPKIIIEKPKV